jgi:hypothetical protein
MNIDFPNWSAKKKIVVSVIGALFVMGVIGAVFGEDPDISGSQTPATTDSADETTVPKSPAQALQELVEKEAGSKSNLDGNSSRIRTVSIEDGRATIEMNGDENLTEGTTKSSNRRLVLDAIKALKSSGVNYEIAFIAVHYPLVNNLGETAVEPVLRYTFSLEQIGRIQPDNVDTKGMDSNFADLGTIVHPAFVW